MNHKRSILKLAAAFGILAAASVIVINWRSILFNGTNLLIPPYDPAFYEKHYEVENGVTYVRDIDNGERYPVLRSLSDGFENANTIRDLVGFQRGWTQFTLLSPEAPTVSDFNNLSHLILKGEGDFLDNRIEPSSEHAHSGTGSLKALAVAPVGGKCCTKASLHTLLLHFVKGDHVWFSAWYFIEEAGDFITLMDLESTYVRGWPGMRIRLHKEYLQFELAKWEPKAVYRQPEGEEIPFPMGEWVLIEAHLLLSEDNDGVIQLWQNNELIIDRLGQTLPFAGTLYDSLEIGISAYSHGPGTAILYVDDLLITGERMDELN